MNQLLHSNQALSADKWKPCVRYAIRTRVLVGALQFGLDDIQKLRIVNTFPSYKSEGLLHLEDFGNIVYKPDLEILVKSTSEIQVSSDEYGIYRLGSSQILD